MNAPIDRSAWSTAVPDWVDRIRQGRSLMPTLPLHEAYADKALRLFKALRVPDIPGFPTYGEVCGEWVFEWVRAIFGSYDPVEKVRHLREFFCMIPKKNGKTSIAAAIIVVACILNEAPEAQFILIAPTMKLAETAFDHAAGIIQKTALRHGEEEVPLTDLFYPQKSLRTILNQNPDQPSKILIKAADADIVTGVKNATVLVDETHVFANRPSAKGVFTEIRGAMSHPQNRHFLLQITTQSKVPPTGVFRSELQNARRVRDGKAEQPLLPLIYELPLDMVKDGGWKRPETWALVNPHMGRSVDVQFLADQVAKAEDDGADALALVASQHFNVEIGTGQGEDGWTAQRYWSAAADPGLTLEALLDRVDVCTIGVDGGGEDDLCGLVVLGREKQTRCLLAWCHAWAQPEVLTRRQSIAPALREFEADGDLTICDEAFEHVAGVVDVVRQVHERGLLPEQKGVGIDEAGLPELIDELELAEFGQPLLTGVRQGWYLQGAIRSLPLRLKAGQMRHGAQPLFAWSVGNARVELKGSNLKMEKALAGAAKIDVVIALLNAAQLMYHNPVAAGGGVRDYFAAMAAMAAAQGREAAA